MSVLEKLILSNTALKQEEEKYKELEKENIKLLSVINDLIVKLKSLEKPKELIESKLRPGEKDSEEIKWIYRFLSDLGFSPTFRYEILDKRIFSHFYNFHFICNGQGYILEYSDDGSFYYNPSRRDSRDFKKQIQRIKTEVAIEKGIRMIHISYHEKDKIIEHIIKALLEKRKCYVSNPSLYEKIGIIPID